MKTVKKISLALLLTFLIASLLPGDLALTILADQATPENLAALRRDMGLDLPIWERYFIWLGHVLQGDFGRSFRTGQEVLDFVDALFEAAEAIGVVIDYECRVGTCGRCKVPLRQGEVTMEVEDALAADEKASGIILACQAKSAHDLIVDA